MAIIMFGTNCEGYAVSCMAHGNLFNYNCLYNLTLKQYYLYSQIVKDYCQPLNELF